LQALAMMNGRLMADQTALDKSDLLASVINSPFMDEEEKIETLYLAALSRKPTGGEIARAKTFVISRDLRKSTEQQAVCDLFWVLLNSGEFLLNH